MRIPAPLLLLFLSPLIARADGHAVSFTFSSGAFAGARVESGRPVLVRRYDPKTKRAGPASWGVVTAVINPGGPAPQFDVRNAEGRTARFSLKEITPESADPLATAPQLGRGQPVRLGRVGPNLKIEALFPPNLALVRDPETGVAQLRNVSQLEAAGPPPAKPLPDYRAEVFLQLVSSAFELQPTGATGTTNQLTFRPAQSEYLGVGLGYKWLAASYSFSIPASSSIQAAEGTSQYRDLRLSYYSRRFAVELGYSKYTSYLLDNSGVLSAATLNGAQYYKLPSLTTEGLGANVFYVFSPELYSLPASNDHSEIQADSAGSFLALASFRRQAVHNSAAIIPAELQSPFGTEASLSAFRTFSYAAGPGYGYFWRPRYHWLGDSFFIAPLIALSLGYETISEDLAGGTTESGVFGLNVHARFTMGWNSPGFFLILGALVDEFTGTTAGIKFNGTQNSGALTVGARF